MKPLKNSSPSHEHLLLAIAKKQKSALQQLFEAEAESMMSLARQSLLQEQAAQQVFLKTFLIIWDNAGSYEQDMGSAKGWIYSILRYQIREYYHENYQNLALSLAKEPAFKPIGLHEVELARDPDLEVTDSFHYYFEQLTEEQQSSLLTVYLNPDSQAVSATRLGVSLGQLKEDISVGLHHLARSLSKLPHHSEGLILGEYVLGGMSESDQRQVNEIINNTVDSTPLILLWEEVFTEFIAQLQPHSLDPNLWKTLNTRLKEKHRQQKDDERKKYDSSYDGAISKEEQELIAQAEEYTAAGKRMPLSLRMHFIGRSIRFWQGLGIAAVLLALIVLLWPSSGNSVRWVAVLADRATTPNAAWTLKVKQNGAATLVPNYSQLGQSDFELRLWTSQDRGQSMRAISTLDVSKSNHISAEQLGPIQANQLFYISLEPKAGSSATRPTGSIMFQGPTVDLSTE